MQPAGLTVIGKLSVVEDCSLRTKAAHDVANVSFIREADGAAADAQQRPNARTLGRIA